MTYLSTTLKVAADTIDVRERLHRYGLDSVLATSMIAELSRLLGRRLPATLVWDHPTIEALSKQLSSRAAAVQEVKQGRRPEEQSSAAPSDEPIAIIGLACRFPEAFGPQGYWKLLSEGMDAITETPPNRWKIEDYYDPNPKAPGKMNTRWGGYLRNPDRFDPLFFGISPREAIQMDPQQRLMLVMCWEALVDAGLSIPSLKGAPVGVFCGAMWTDYARLPGNAFEAIAQHTATGQDLSILTGRVSYTLGLTGPSITINTACSSGLVAVHLACQSLRLGECTMAIAGAVNMILNPESTIAMSKFGAMAPDGRSKAFDARANGYVRGEGSGAVVLKPLSRALIDGDPVHCVIRGSAVNNDGFSNGLTAPNPQAQEHVLRSAYARAGVRPDRVHYVETHGTGTILGDPIEANALGAVLGAGRPSDRPLRIGSVKTNIGHLESAAGIAG